MSNANIFFYNYLIYIETIKKIVYNNYQVKTTTLDK